MSLLKLLEPPISTHLLPEIEKVVLQEIILRYRNQIEPALWKAQFDSESHGEFSPDFIDESIGIVEKVLSEFTEAGRIAPLQPKQLEYIRETVWEKSQSYWYEYAPELNSALTFIDRLHQSSREEIEQLFPICEAFFGPNAQNLLIDLSFQYELYRYSKIFKPDLIDLRRMINISGQIIESIFAVKVFLEEDLRLGMILDKLSKSRKNLDSFLGFLSKDEASQFLDNLNIVNQIRNKYSHGTSNQQNIEEDFRNCIEALIGDKNGLLFTLYRILGNSTNAPAVKTLITTPPS